MLKLHGIYAPIATPFLNDEISYHHLAENMKFWLSSKLSGIVVMGSNGEFVVLNTHEKKELIKAVCELGQGKKPIIAGTGCESTKETIELTNYAAEVGANAALILSPNYYKKAMTDELIKNFYREVADASSIPIILYNMPGNSGINLSAKLIAELSTHSNIIGVKDSGGNISQISEVIAAVSDEFAVFAGSASFLYPGLALGATGGTLALANILPDECATMLEFVELGKHKEARDIQLKLLEINQAVTARWGVAGLKAAMDMLGLYGGPPRKPMQPLASAERKVLEDILVKAKNSVKEILLDSTEELKCL